MAIDRGLLKDFEAFLLNSGSVPQDKVKFYIHWVWRFLKSCHYQLDSINTESLSQYLDSLEADEKIADWQVKQATDAVILYVEKYLNKSLQPGIPKAKDSREQSIDQKVVLHWEQTLEEVKNSLRLRHLSLSTEKNLSRMGFPL